MWAWKRTVSFLSACFFRPLNSRSVYLSMLYLFPFSRDHNTMDQVQMQLFLYLSAGINIISVIFYTFLLPCSWR